ncbi:hypothetical protein P280DRAFT_553476 [Massarina eburnea CBS 473.64]|uniref:Uncharacterized protein n=1 Tax=Massarina eburnea CBS 473.64 TaxID=1395130 RepID=A0A6A6RP09_9PLEO|nr:hypothetical protein P280DRAFT_553476 [Massarina eburnea CBS 473.64]
MFIKGLVLAVLSATVSGNQIYSNVEHNFGVMLTRGEAMAKRQGYYPSTRPCGTGNTCVEACGAGQEQCSSKNGLYCHDPTRSACCPDLSGKSCQTGYFCTTDGKPTPATYCCPEGMDLAVCAKAYSLTVSLIRQSNTIAASSVSSLASTSVSSTETLVSSITASSTPLIHITSPTATATVRPSPSSTVTTSPPTQFTGVAAKARGAGIAVLAGVAGFAQFL